MNQTLTKAKVLLIAQGFQGYSMGERTVFTTNGVWKTGYPHVKE